jgi:hypothetical protein
VNAINTETDVAAKCSRTRPRASRRSARSPVRRHRRARRGRVRRGVRQTWRVEVGGARLRSEGRPGPAHCWKCARTSTCHRQPQRPPPGASSRYLCGRQGRR